MQKTFLIYLFLFLTLNGLGQDYLQGRVIKVADGDTFTILDGSRKKTRVRLHGIDCPEKGQDYFQVAKDYTNRYVFDKRVKVEIKSKDRYGRIVGVVWLENGANLNLMLIQKGLAWDYPVYSKSQLYRNAEQQARKLKTNIWSLRKPVAPWDFRKQKKVKRA